MKHIGQIDLAATVHHVSLPGDPSGAVIVYEVADSTWEWAVSDAAGRILAESKDAGYGHPSYALRDGLIKALPTGA